MTTKDIITLTIRIPRNLWIKLRRLQEEGKIQSIQQASVEALQKLVAGSGEKKGK